MQRRFFLSSLLAAPTVAAAASFPARAQANAWATPLPAFEGEAFSDWQEDGGLSFLLIADATAVSSVHLNAARADMAGLINESMLAFEVDVSLVKADLPDADVKALGEGHVVVARYENHELKTSWCSKSPQNEMLALFA